MATYRLMDGTSGRPGTGSSGTQPPSAATAYTGNYIAGLVFQVTSGGMWFQGYWWWVPTTSGVTAAQKFALWQVTGNQAGSVVPGSAVTSGTLAAGTFSFVALAAPLALTPDIPYVAATGFASTSPQGFPDTVNQFNTGNPYAAGITNGPLNAYGAGGTPTGNVPQMPFATTSADPAAVLPVLNNANDILWLDCQVTDTAPAGATYRAWPAMISPWPAVQTADDITGYTLGFEFSLSQACSLQRIWHYSPPGSASLPSRCCLWNVATVSVVSGTDNTSPAWSGAAGSGWVSCDYTAAGVTLATGVNYKASTFLGPGSTWFGATPNIFGPANLQQNGFTHGPLAIPGNAAASPGQQSWNTVTFGYPATSSNPEADWIDVEVIPVAAPAAQPSFLYQMRTFH